MVVHTAGPFQRRTDPTLMRCCVKHKIPYVDVCDEFELAAKAKELFDQSAKTQGVTAVVASGIWPGVSARMAANAVGKLEAEHPDQKADTIEFSIFTAWATNAMRVDVTSKDGTVKVSSQIVHDDLEMCVGLATAAFAIEVLKKGDDKTIPDGVWYPAELLKEARSNILEAVREGSLTYVV